VYVPQTILDLTHALLTAYKSEPQLFQMLCILPISNSSKLNSFSVLFGCNSTFEHPAYLNSGKK
jgi:hypothetical protein